MLLGAFQVALNGTPVTTFRSVKTQALLAYLAVESERPHRREALAGLLWPDQPESVALHNLSQTLNQLRQALDDHHADPPFLLINRRAIQWNQAADSWLDVGALTACMAGPQTHPHPDLLGCPSCMQQLQQAVDLYRGPFLDGFFVRDSDLFEAWILLKREWLHGQVLQALDALAVYYERRREWEAALHAARRQIEIDPFREAAHRQVMRLLALRGQRNAALMHYETYRRWLADQLAVEPADETTILYGRILAGDLDGEAQGMEHFPHWNETPDLGSFYGRADDLATLERWVIADGCRVVAVLGIGGVGKTAVAAKLVESMAHQFDRVLWRSVLNAPPLNEVLWSWLQALANLQIARLPQRFEERLSLLLDCLRRQRCLLVLDNLESLFQGGEPAARYRTGYEDYGHLIQRIGQSRHQSCLLLTSRERPMEVARMERETVLVRSLRINGLDVDAGQALLRERGLTARFEQSADLVERYSGNPLALQLVAETIQELFAGNIAAFLHEAAPIFEDIRDVLAQQFERLAPLERELLLWLAIEREPISVADLQSDLVRPETQRAVLEALRSLQRRSLLEQRGDRFTLQNMIMEYSTDRLISEVAQAFVNEAVEGVNRYALTKAQVKEYIRQAQIRLILDPVAQQLAARFGPTGVHARFHRLLSRLREEVPRAPGYAAGNILNLLIHLGYDCQGYDFSHLSVWQAYLRGVALGAVNMAHADLSGSVFTDAFRAVIAVAVHHSDDLLAAGTTDGAVRLWRVNDGQLVGLWAGHAGHVRSIRFSPDGTTLATASHDHTIRLWDVPTGQTRGILEGHMGAVSSIGFSPGGASLVSGSYDQTVRVWDIATRAVARILHGHIAFVSAVAWSPDGTTLASGSHDYTVRLWDAVTGQLVRVLVGHSNTVLSLAYEPDGRILASGSADRTVRLWDARTGQELHVLQGHSDWISSLAFNTNGDLLASSGADRPVRVWDVARAQCRHILYGHTSWASSVAFGHDPALLVSGSWDQTVRIWNAETGQVLTILRGYTGWVRALAFNPEGTVLLSGGHDQMVRLWDAATGCLLQTLRGHSDAVAAVACHPDGITLASASHDRTVRLWNRQTGRTERMLQGHTDAVNAVAYSPDGAVLASASADQTVRVWDAGSGQLLQTLQGHTDWIIALAYSPDGRTLASAGGDRTIRVWDAGTGQPAHILGDHSDTVSAVAYSPDGRLLASGSWDLTVRVWNVHSGENIQVLQGHSNLLQSVAFSRDGRLLASGGMDETIRVWDTATAQCVRILEGHSGAIFVLAFSRDGATLASGSDDETIKLWDVPSGECRQTVRALGPYAGLQITAATGVTEAQKAALKVLGAVE
jgi:WD40 repeat protein/DNA-binding SARP family transcriptional activator